MGEGANGIVGARGGEGLVSVKAVIVGDGGCGKTSLLMVFAKGDFPEVRETYMRGQDQGCPPTGSRKLVKMGEGANGIVGARGGEGLVSVKAVIVGDGGCGKTSLLMVFAKGDFPEVYVPTVFEKYTANFQLGNKSVEINLWDTAGQEDYDRLRPLSYTGANVILICYDVTNPESYDNVQMKWHSEVNHFCKGVPILLVGCKTDLRKDKVRLRKLREDGLEPITYQKGQSMCRDIRAVTYLECSAKFRENILDIFSEAATAALHGMKRKQRNRRKKRGCVLS